LCESAQRAQSHLANCRQRCTLGAARVEVKAAWGAARTALWCALLLEVLPDQRQRRAAGDVMMHYERDQNTGLRGHTATTTGEAGPEQSTGHL